MLVRPSLARFAVDGQKEGLSRKLPPGMRQRKKLRKLAEAQQPRARDSTVDGLGSRPRRARRRRRTGEMAAANSSVMAPMASGSGSTEQQGASPAVRSTLPSLDEQALMTGALQWRQFSFFTHETVESVHDRSSCPYALRSPHAIACLSAGQESVLVADLDGEVKQLGRDYEVTRSWTAYEDGRCTLMQWSGIKGVLVTVGVRLPLVPAHAAQLM